MIHIEDLIWVEKYPKQLIQTLCCMANSNAYTLKWDGAPAIVFGYTTNAEFFLSTKSFFNKTPKYATSKKQLFEIFKPQLAKELADCWDILENIISNHLDEPDSYCVADLLFTKNTIRYDDNGELFHPNIIQYRPVKPISNRAEMGIALHGTTYRYMHRQEIQSWLTASGVYCAPMNVRFNLQGGDYSYLNTEIQEIIDSLKTIEIDEPDYQNIKLSLIHTMYRRGLYDMDESMLSMGLRGALHARVTRLKHFILNRVAPTEFNTSVIRRNGYKTPVLCGHEGLVLGQSKLVDRYVFTRHNDSEQFIRGWEL